MSNRCDHQERFREVLFAKNGCIACELEAIGQMRPIETAPKDGTYILLFGPSGYTTTPLRCEVCRYDAEYRPLQPWVNHADNSFLDGGDAPTHWTPLPKIPMTYHVNETPLVGSDDEVPMLRTPFPVDDF